MLAFSLSLALLVSSQTPPVSVIHAAPFGSALRRTYPEIGIFFDSERPQSHMNPIAPIAAQGTAASCEQAFHMALGRLASDAREAGGNGIVEMRSPGAGPGGAPAFACQTVDNGFKVQLTALAAHLNGSDAPPPPVIKPTLPGLMATQPVRPLPRVYGDSPVLLTLPTAMMTDRSTRFAGRGGDEAFTRRIHDVDAQGGSTNSCADALQIALIALHRDAARFDAVGVAGVRSPDLGVAEGGQKYLCEQRGGLMTVRLTGVAAGLPL